MLKNNEWKDMIQTQTHETGKIDKMIRYFRQQCPGADCMMK